MYFQIDVEFAYDGSMRYIFECRWGNQCMNIHIEYYKDKLGFWKIIVEFY